MPVRAAMFVIACTVTVAAVSAQDSSRGILSQPAPNWDVTEWFNLPEGETSIDVDDVRGKVVYLYCFQSWCPGCHSHGFPTLRAVRDRFADAEDVAFVAVQTAFEGFHTNTAENALRTARRYDLDIPIGHDGSADERSGLMRRYRTGGTPWTIIIDKHGVVRFNDFHTTVDDAVRLIDRLRAEPGPREPVEVETLPESRGGQDRIGTEMPRLRFDRWLNLSEENEKPRTGQVTLYRWWTDACPYCQASLPAIERLREEHADDGLAVVAVYHPKPPRRVDDDEVARRADELGFRGAIALDLDWSELRRAYLESARRRATSVSILVDADGVVRFVHPGPVLFPSSDPAHEVENADFELLEKAVEALLGTADE